MTKEQKQYDALTPEEQELYLYFMLEYKLDSCAISEKYVELTRTIFPIVMNFADAVEKIIKNPTLIHRPSPINPKP